MNKSRSVILVLALAGFVALLCAQESVPLLINYQGKLTDGTGSTVPDGNYEIAFKIWSAGSAGQLTWGRTYPIHVVGGLFNVVLGDGGSAIAGAQTDNLRLAFLEANRYLGLTITKDQTGATISNPQEIVPRQQLLSAPYALAAANATRVSGLTTNDLVRKVGDTVGGNLGVSGTLTVSQNSTLSGAASVGGNLSVGGSATVSGNATVTGNVTVSGTLSASRTTGGGFVPVGGIVMWFGRPAEVPAGWALCDGNNGTPDLRNRFVLGWGNVGVGNWGGSATQALTVDQMPRHNHGYVDGYFAEAWGWDSSSGRVYGSDEGTDTDNYIFTRNMTTAGAGSGSAFSIMPPYYVLAYIMRTQ